VIHIGVELDRRETLSWISEEGVENPVSSSIGGKKRGNILDR